MDQQPGRLVALELQRTWKLHAKLLVENRSTKPEIDKKVTKASDCCGFTTPKLVAGLPLLRGGMACALGLQWWTKDTTQSVLILDCNIVYSLPKQSSYIASQWSEDSVTKESECEEDSV